MNIDLKNQTALITGSSKGIGLAIASRMLDANANVIINSRNNDELTKTASMLTKNFPNKKIIPSAFDISDIDQISSWFNNIRKLSGPINILVNNAGITHREFAKDIHLNDFDKVLMTNVNAVLKICQEFFTHLKGQPGKIVNISSMISNLARKTNIAYSSSKGALNQLTRSLALEWARNKINVNALAPGFIKTDLTGSLLKDDEFNQWVKTRCPMGRWGNPTDISSTAVFLASDAANYITGQIIYVDGGITATV